jgi:hypothetical protein
LDWSSADFGLDRTAGAISRAKVIFTYRGSFDLILGLAIFEEELWAAFHKMRAMHRHSLRCRFLPFDNASNRRIHTHSPTAGGRPLELGHPREAS